MTEISNKSEAERSFFLYSVESGNAERNGTLSDAISTSTTCILRMGFSAEHLRSPFAIRRRTLPGFLRILLWEALSEIELRDFRAYILSTPPESLWSIVKALAIRLLLDSEHKKRSANNASREYEVTLKHRFGWKEFLKSGRDYLIVFEDDVILKRDSADRFGTYLEYSKAISPESLLYVDVAGGFPHEMIPLPPVISNSGGIKAFGDPVTNTAAGYIVSKGLAQRLIQKSKPTNLFRVIGIDFFLNRLLRRISAREEVECLHLDPPIFTHGSMAGEYESWTKVPNWEYRLSEDHDDT